MKLSSKRAFSIALSAIAVPALTFPLSVPDARADETCNSPYTARLIKGQEDYLHVWTLGIEGMGDGSDKLVVRH